MLYMIVAFVLTIFFIFSGSYVNSTYNLSVNDISPTRFTAPTDVVDRVATERLKEEARNSVAPLYKHDSGVQEKALSNIDSFFNTLNLVYDENESIADTINSIKSSGLSLPVALSYSQSYAYFQLGDTPREEYRTMIKNTVSELFEQGITSDTLESTYAAAEEKINTSAFSDVLKETAALITNSALSPNLVVDEEALELAREKKASEVGDVIIKKDQKIVDEGEIITEEIYTVLTDLNLINKANFSTVTKPFWGSVIIIFVLFIAALLYFRDQNNKILENTRNSAMLFLFYVLAIVCARIMAPITNYSLIPLTVFAMIIATLINARTAIVMNIFISIAAIFIYNGSLEFLMFFIITGTIASLLMRYTNKRNYIMLIAIIVGILNFVCLAAINLFFYATVSQNAWKYSIFAGVMGIILTVLAVGSMPLWEVLFEVNTPLRLLDLINPTNELLRRLMLEAPGTYHHSLLVANLAENAAIATEANPNLTRVGAYYHDIGKLKFPIYFTENQHGDNPHQYLDPYTSAKIIIDHIPYGKELAVKNGLPKAIIDIICQHHGTTLAKYFYVEAANQLGIENVSEADFRYPGPIPQTKEAAIVMLADTVEAAVRATMNAGSDLDEIEALISSLIKQKMDDGQLAAAPVTFKDIDIIKHEFMQVFKGMYHKRIAYPDLNQKEAEKKELIEAHKALPAEEEIAAEDIPEGEEL